MRGKVFLELVQVTFDRITPAYAGKSNICILRPCRIRDHPRLCGEKDAPKTSEETYLGSPPPMRGKAKSRLRSLPRVRITPAYAGKSAV